MRTNEELIAEARDVLSRPIRGDHENEKARGIITRLSDALEQVTAERDELKVDFETKSIVHECCEKAQERDALAQTIERIKVARSNHPVCELHEGDGAVVCGWKSTVLDIDAALNKGDS